MCVRVRVRVRACVRVAYFEDDLERGNKDSGEDFALSRSAGDLELKLLDLLSQQRRGR